MCNVIFWIRLPLHFIRQVFLLIQFIHARISLSVSFWLLAVRHSFSISVNVSQHILFAQMLPTIVCWFSPDYVCGLLYCLLGVSCSSVFIFVPQFRWADWLVVSFQAHVKIVVSFCVKTAVGAITFVRSVYKRSLSKGQTAERPKDWVQTNHNPNPSVNPIPKGLNPKLSAFWTGAV